MTDVFDRASEVEEAQRAEALQEQLRRGHLGDPARWRELSAKWCQAPHCVALIPDARRRALPGVQLCVECAQIEESRR